MGFRNRLKRVWDESLPIERRVMALCGALTYCHLGFHGGKRELESRFGIEIGSPISSEALTRAANYLMAERENARRAHGVFFQGEQDPTHEPRSTNDTTNPS